MATLSNPQTGGYYEACGGNAGNLGDFSALTPAQAQAACCANALCAGFSFAYDANHVTGSGFYKTNAMCGLTKNAGYEGWDKVRRRLRNGSLASNRRQPRSTGGR